MMYFFFYDSFGFGSACASGGDRSKSIGFFFCWQHRSRQGLDPPSLTSTTLLSVSMADLWKLRICMSRREKMRQKKNEINKKIGSPPHPSHSIHSFAPLWVFEVFFFFFTRAGWLFHDRIQAKGDESLQKVAEIFKKYIWKKNDRHGVSITATVKRESGNRTGEKIPKKKKKKYGKNRNSNSNNNKKESEKEREREKKKNKIGFSFVALGRWETAS